MQYILAMIDENGKFVSTRKLSFNFGGIGVDEPGTNNSDEEYLAGIKAREMYRDAAYLLGKFPEKKDADI